MNHFLKSISGIIGLFLFLMSFAGCGKDEKGSASRPKPAPQLLEKPISNSVNLAEVKNGVLVFDRKSILDKDLILGGEIRDVGGSDVNGAGGLIMGFLPTQLVRFEFVEDLVSSDGPSDSQDEEGPASTGTLHIIKSPFCSWNCATLDYPHVIASILVKDFSDKEIKVDAKEFTSLLSVSLESVIYQREFVGLFKDFVAVDENHLILPFEVKSRLGSELDPLRLSLVLYFKRWLPKKIEHPKIHKDYGYFTLFEWGKWASGDWTPYRDQLELYPEDPILNWDLSQGPIEYVITDTIPEKYRSLFKRAIESWNDGFKQGGGDRPAVVVRQQKADDKILIGDPRYHYVYWERNPFKGISGAHASFQADPITGEIYHANVYFGGETLVRALRRAYRETYRSESGSKLFQKFLKEGVLFPEAASQDESKKMTNDLFGLAAHPIQIRFADVPFRTVCAHSVSPFLKPEDAMVTEDEFVEVWLEEAVIHEVGHNWGLRHNFKGSLGASIVENKPPYSVMDYNDDRLILYRLFLTTPGKYDLEAIAYGYGGNPKEALPFCTDDDLGLSPFDPDNDPKCMVWDSGASPLQESLLPDLEKFYIRLFVSKDSQEAEKSWGFFVLRLLQSVFYLSRLGSVEDKQALNEAIAKITLLSSATVGSGGTRDLTQSWLYSWLRPQLPRVVLSLAADLPFSRDLLHDSLLTTVENMIVQDPTAANRLSSQMRESLIDALFGIRRHPNDRTQLVALTRLEKIRDALKHEWDPALGVSRKSEIEQLLALVENRIKSFYGRELGDRD